MLIYHERAIGMLKGCVGRKNRIVGFNDRARELRSGIHAELELGFLAVISGQFLKEKGSET